MRKSKKQFNLNISYRDGKLVVTGNMGYPKREMPIRVEIILGWPEKDEDWMLDDNIEDVRDAVEDVVNTILKTFDMLADEL